MEEVLVGMRVKMIEVGEILELVQEDKVQVDQVQGIEGIEDKFIIPQFNISKLNLSQ